MNSPYQILLCFILISVFNSCTADKNEDAGIPVLFSITDTATESERKSLFSDSIILDNNNPSMLISGKAMKWERKDFFNTKTSWAATSNVVSWATGDRIGIYMRSSSGGSNYYDRDNAQYNVTTGGSSVAALNAVSDMLSFPNPTSNVQFFAYYPYSATAGTALSVNYALPVDQSTQSSLSAADIMCSNSPIKNGASPNVSFNFSHKMVLLSFKINTTLLPAQLAKVTVSGSSVTNSGVLNLSTGSVTPNTTLAFSPSVSKNQSIGAATYAYVDVIINPCAIANNADMSKLKVTLSFNGLLSHSTGLVTSGTFVGGTRYVYNLTVLLSL